MDTYKLSEGTLRVSIIGETIKIRCISVDIVLDYNARGPGRLPHHAGVG